MRHEINLVGFEKPLRKEVEEEKRKYQRSPGAKVSQIRKAPSASLGVCDGSAPRPGIWETNSYLCQLTHYVRVDLEFVFSVECRSFQEGEFT